MFKVLMESRYSAELRADRRIYYSGPVDQNSKSRCMGKSTVFVVLLALSKTRLSEWRSGTVQNSYQNFMISSVTQVSRVMPARLRCERSLI